ncbi:hypothetical protein SAMN02745866_00883 [Alteromonadaceae bacterium Bs31]|nr:hypothetical protein SAMN02745866_00883 [Alteromonadaceae bacterium Bs31]
MPLIKRCVIRPEDVPLVVSLTESFQYSYQQAGEEAFVSRIIAGLLQERALSGVMLVESSEQATSAEFSTDKVVSLAITGFIDRTLEQQFLAERADTPLIEWLYQQESEGSSVFLRPEAQAECNRGKGMTLVFAHFFAPSGDLSQPEVQKAVAEMQDCFRLQHAGHHCRAALHPVQNTNEQRTRASLQAMGFEAIGEKGILYYLDLDKLAASPFHPFVCLIKHKEPVLALSSGEKRLLELALWAYGDKEIADYLNISNETVRKRWRNIYLKVSQHPELSFFTSSEVDPSNPVRGPEKRSQLLRYIESNLCEIRP